jgi:hypothetical protein
MLKLAGQSVGIIGTGATAVQCVPHLSRDSRELYVFQRTPSSVDVRNNHPIDPHWFAEIATPGWQRRWLENFTANQAGGTANEDLVQDGWTDIARRIRARDRRAAAGGPEPRRHARRPRRIRLRVEGALRRHDLVVSSDEADLHAIAAAIRRRLEVDRP